MSKNIILAKYKKNKLGKITEDGSIVIGSVSFPDFLEKKISESYFLDLLIYEEGDIESYKQNVFSNNKLINILDNLVLLLKKQIIKFNNEENSEKTNNEILNKMTLILNMRKLILKKIEEFPEDETVYLVVG